MCVCACAECVGRLATANFGATSAILLHGERNQCRYAAGGGGIVSSFLADGIVRCDGRVWHVPLTGATLIEVETHRRVCIGHPMAGAGRLLPPPLVAPCIGAPKMYVPMPGPLYLQSRSPDRVWCVCLCLCLFVCTLFGASLCMAGIRASSSAATHPKAYRDSVMAAPLYVPLAYQVSGRCIPLKWKAWSNEDGSADWELWAILQALVPKRNWQGKHIRAQKVLSSDFGGWFKWVSHLHGSEAVVRPSAKSLRSLGMATDARTHDTAAISTYGVLSLLPWAMAFRKDGDQPRVRRAMLPLVLGCDLPRVVGHGSRHVLLSRECPGGVRPACRGWHVLPLVAPAWGAL